MISLFTRSSAGCFTQVRYDFFIASRIPPRPFRSWACDRRHLDVEYHGVPGHTLEASEGFSERFGHLLRVSETSQSFPDRRRHVPGRP